MSPVIELLKKVIDREKCVLRYDMDLVGDLPEVLREVKGVKSESDLKCVPELKELCERVGVPYSISGVREIPMKLRSLELDLSEFSTRNAYDRGKEFESYTDVDGSEGRQLVLKLQEDLGRGMHRAGDQAYDPHLLKPEEVRNYLASVTTPPAGRLEKILKMPFWEIMVKKWQLFGSLSNTVPSLSIGCRWLTEVLYFRQICNLEKHIGLDLHTGDENLVKAGDMHSMPFDSNTFGFVFIKNTVDKSYDIRALVSEMIRVTRPNGIIVVDQICGYGWTTSLTRTDIQSAANLLKIFQSQVRCRVLVCRDIDISGIGDAAANNESRKNARLAIRLLA